MKKILFNDNWKYGRGSGTALLALFGGSSSEKNVTLPYDAAMDFDRDSSNVMGSGNAYIKEENCYYNKTFFVENGSDDVFILEFEGVYQNASVYVNNSYVGSNSYGYSSFSFDITRFISFGNENVIKVVVKSGQTSGRWYTGTGIYRDVNLYTSKSVYIECNRTKVTTRDVDKDMAVLTIEPTIVNRTNKNTKTRIHISLFDKDENQVAFTDLPAFVQQNEKYNVFAKLYVKKPLLWDAEEPNLYTYKVELFDENSLIDSETNTFGIRKMQLDPVNGLRINGKKVLLRGGCLHHDNGIIGAADYYHSAEEKIKKLKTVGYNAIRSSHYPIGKHILDACDKYGMYVMDEFSDVWTTTKVDFDYGMHMADSWAHDINEMIKKDYNHPSVIMYSIGNEIPEVGNTFDVQIGRKISEYIRSLDDTRYIINCMNLTLAVMDRLPEVMGELVKPGEEINSLMNNLGEAMGRITGSDYVSKATEEASSYIDITGLNYAAIRYEKDRELFPDRIVLGSETYSKDLDINWKLVESINNVIGDFNWTCWDYIGEAGIGQITYGDENPAFYGQYPWKLAYCGDFDIIGDRRPVSYWRERIWKYNLPPYIAVQNPCHHGEVVKKSQWAFTDAEHNWYYPEFEGKDVTVEVYTDADEVELLINGASVGRKSVGEDKQNIVVFETQYTPGVIKAIAYKNNITTGEDIIKTPSDKVHLSATTDKEILAIGDVAYIDISILDENDIINTNIPVTLSIDINETGTIIGAGSANPKTEERYRDTTFTTFNGRGRVAVKRISDGEIQVKISSNLFIDELAIIN